MTFKPGDTGRTRDGLGEYTVRAVFRDGSVWALVRHPDWRNAALDREYYRSGRFTRFWNSPLDLLPPETTT